MKIYPATSVCSFLLCFFLIAADGVRPPLTLKESKKYVKKVPKKSIYRFKPHKYKQTVDFVKKLEYDTRMKDGSNALDFGLSPLDLNLLPDEEFAVDVEAGVVAELDAIDQEFGDAEITSTTIGKKTKPVGPLSLMHQGMYIPSPEFNSLIDALINNAKKNINKREMDPLYFAIHNRGVVRHVTKTNTLAEQLVGALKQVQNPQNPESESTLPLGVGHIRGLSDLKRFGNAESRKDGEVTLVRSHYFFGPLTIDFIFATDTGIHTINTTLSSLAAHALLEVTNKDNSTVLKEFITDSPMKYEIRLRGAKNRRFRDLSQSAISRLFKRGSRMETRLERSFVRALRDPLKTDQGGKKNGKGNLRRGRKQRGNAGGGKNQRQRANKKEQPRLRKV